MYSWQLLTSYLITYSTPQKIDIDIENQCDPKNIQGKKPTQQLFEKKSNNQPTLVFTTDLLTTH